MQPSHQSYFLDDENMSSVSFNTRFLEANFGDSISQAGASEPLGMPEDYSGALMMDLGQLT